MLDYPNHMKKKICIQVTGSENILNSGVSEEKHYAKKIDITFLCFQGLTFKGKSNVI